MKAAVFVAVFVGCGARTELYSGVPVDASSPDAAVQDVSQPDVLADAPPDAPAFAGAVRITAGSASTCAIKASGSAMCWGDNSVGELGNGTMGTHYNVPEQVLGLTSGVVDISLSGSGGCAVTQVGAASCWGDDKYGQLGHGDFTSTFGPTSVAGVSNGVAIAGGGIYANCVLLGTGVVECMGGDYDGNLVLGSITSMNYPTPQTSKVTGAIALAGSGVAGNVANCAVLANGRAQCWGFMQYSLGDGSTAASGEPFTVPGITNAAAVATSGQNICVVLHGGAMTCWGENLWGEVGDGTTITRTTPVTTTLTNVASVSLGSGHTCVVTTSGAALCIGHDAQGQLGNGTPTTAPTVTWQTVIPSGVVGVACGGAHTCALMSDGTVQCWGDNSFGQLGDGTNTERDSPVTVVGF